MNNDLRRWMKLCEAVFYGFDEEEPEDTVVPLSYGRPALPDQSDHEELIKYYIYGGCSKFALILSDMFGYRIAAAIIDEHGGDYDDENDVPRSAQHIFCLINDTTAVDIRGKTSVEEMLFEWRTHRKPELLVFDSKKAQNMKQDEMFRPTERRMLRAYINKHADWYM